MATNDGLRKHLQGDSNAMGPGTVTRVSPKVSNSEPKRKLGGKDVSGLERSAFSENGYDAIQSGDVRLTFDTHKLGDSNNSAGGSEGNLVKGKMPKVKPDVFFNK